MCIKKKIRHTMNNLTVSLPKCNIETKATHCYVDIDLNINRSDHHQRPDVIKFKYQKKSTSMVLSVITSSPQSVHTLSKDNDSRNRHSATTCLVLSAIQSVLNCFFFFVDDFDLHEGGAPTILIILF